VVVVPRREMLAAPYARVEAEFQLLLTRKPR
jgi:RNase P protein component